MGTVLDTLRRGFAWVCPVEGFSAEERLRARVMSLACLIMGVLQFANAGYGLTTDLSQSPAMPWLAFSVGVIIMLTAFVPRFTRSADIYGVWVSVVALGGFFLASRGSDPNAIDGGTGLSEMPLMVGCIMFIAMIGNRRTTMLYFVGAMALIGYMLTVASQAGLSPFDWAVMKHRANQAMMGLILVGVSARFMIEAVFANYDRLRTERDRAAAAEAKRANLLATMSHEIRTPLGGIVGVADILAKEGDCERVAIIQRSADHLMDIVNGILEQAKAEANRTADTPTGPARLNLRETSIAELLEECCALYQAKAATKAIWIGTDLPDAALHNDYWVDTTLLRQTLTNLIANAVKFTTEGGVRIGARIVGFGIDRTSVHFYVQDTGAGIAPEDHDRVLCAFEQSDSAHQTAERGTGLGLSITREAVTRMGGRLALQSALGQGSVFSFVLPLTTVECAAAA